MNQPESNRTPKKSEEPWPQKPPGDFQILCEDGDALNVIDDFLELIFGKAGRHEAWFARGRLVGYGEPAAHHDLRNIELTAFLAGIWFAKSNPEKVIPAKPVPVEKPTKTAGVAGYG